MFDNFYVYVVTIQNTEIKELKKWRKKSELVPPVIHTSQDWIS